MRNDHLRLAVTGLTGQVVSALIESAPKDVEIIALGRPQLELSRRDTVFDSLRNARCDLIINAAAYTHVDKAEREFDLAMRVNSEGAENVAQAAEVLDVPLLHLSTDYVFDGSLGRPYREDDKTNPISVYGQSKLSGEEKIRAVHNKHIILRTAWVYSPFGSNFVKTMLHLSHERDEISVVDDQIGNPTSAIDIARALVTIARVLIDEPSVDLYGTFHMSGQGEASWAEMAQVILESAQNYNKKIVKLRHITTHEYPTAARRPANSRLDNSKLEKIYGITLPLWRPSLTTCVERLLKENH